MFYDQLLDPLRIKFTRNDNFITPSICKCIKELFSIRAISNKINSMQVAYRFCGWRCSDFSRIIHSHFMGTVRLAIEWVREGISITWETLRSGVCGLWHRKRANVEGLISIYVDYYNKRIETVRVKYFKRTWEDIDEIGLWSDLLKLKIKYSMHIVF